MTLRGLGGEIDYTNTGIFNGLTRIEFPKNIVDGINGTAGLVNLITREKFDGNVPEGINGIPSTGINTLSR